jgi:hypothetical protein
LQNIKAVYVNSKILATCKVTIHAFGVFEGESVFIHSSDAIWVISPFPGWARLNCRDNRCSNDPDAVPFVFQYNLVVAICIRSTFCLSGSYNLVVDI